MRLHRALKAGDNDEPLTGDALGRVLHKLNADVNNQEAHTLAAANRKVVEVQREYNLLHSQL
jgi:hypothetical protein